MQQSRTKAIRALRSPRCFSTSAARAAASPYRSAQFTQTAAASPKIAEAKRTQSTAAAAKAEPRARPAPAFNREDYSVQPLRKQHQEMDHSLVGLKGGEIFHEMMMRHGVKHICMPTPCRLLQLTHELC
jgi:acetolactate synthase-1/2/3 large subunit